MIYMTTDEWKEISKIMEEKDFYKLAAEIAVRTYDLGISEQELDEAMKDSVIDSLQYSMFRHETNRQDHSSDSFYYNGPCYDLLGEFYYSTNFHSIDALF